MKWHWAEHYAQDSRESYKGVIFSNATMSMRKILEVMKSLEIVLQSADNESHVETIFKQPHHIQEETLPPGVGLAIKTLWAGAGIQYAYSRRWEYDLCCSCSYYCDSIERIAEQDYVPTDEDILKARERTTGIVEFTFETRSGLIWRVFDTGGVKCDRRKVMHYFEIVNVIIYTVDITCFDEPVFEGENFYRMQESLYRFDAVINNFWFKKTAFVLLFTKTANLAQRLKHTSIKKYITDFTGRNTPEDYVPFITRRFENLKRDEEVVLEVRYPDIDGGLGSMACVAEDACYKAVVEKALRSKDQ